MQVEWWYASGGTRKGPISTDVLRQKLFDGSVTTSDLVWTEGMSEWTAVCDVPVLSKMIQALPPELPKTAVSGPSEPFVTTEPSPLESPTPTPEFAGPWRRLFARTIDFWVIGLPTGFLVVLFLAPVSPGFAQWLQKPGADYALGFFVTPLVLVVEAVVFGVFGTTLGKWLLGIRIKTLASKELWLMDYLFRQAGVYWYGLGTGFPLISLFTMARQRSRLKSGRAATYDEGQFHVTAKRISAFRYVAAALVMLAMSALNGFLLMLNQVDSNRATVSKSHPTVSESQRTNPVVAPISQLVPGQVFKDCQDCPDMVVIPAGSFIMGSSIDEQQLAEKGGGLKENIDRESPQRQVSVRSFASGKYAVTKGQFAQFVQANGYETEAERGDGCFAWTGSKWENQADKNWRNVGFTQNEFHPVVCVSWKDSQAYLQWLNQITGKSYRLLSEAEREYVARGGSQSAFWWGENIGTAIANYNGSPIGGEFRQATVPVQSFNPNPYGLYNVHGNVWEWVQDCFENNYSVGQPTDGIAHRGQDRTCMSRVLRGGSWSDYPISLRSASRSMAAPGSLSSNNGFRIARSIP